MEAQGLVVEVKKDLKMRKTPEMERKPGGGLVVVTAMVTQSWEIEKSLKMPGL